MRLFAAIALSFAGLAGGLAAQAGGAGGRAERPCPPRPPTTTHPIVSPRWLSGAIVTEYYPVREAWFSGTRVRVPGLPGRRRVDWLYGPHGVAMNGEGLGADGRFYHFAGPYGTGWVNVDGQSTLPCWNGVWTNGSPAWLAFGWRNGRGQVTFPLAGGGWSNGSAVRYLPPPPQLRFAAGRSRAAAVLACGRGRPGAHPARQPCLHPRLLRHAREGLVPRARHRRRDHRRPRRRLPRAAADARAARAPRAAHLRRAGRRPAAPTSRAQLPSVSGERMPPAGIEPAHAV